LLTLLDQRRLRARRVRPGVVAQGDYVSTQLIHARQFAGVQFQYTPVSQILDADEWKAVRRYPIWRYEGNRQWRIDAPDLAAHFRPGELAYDGDSSL